MTEDPRPTGATGGPMSERMQALLSRAAEEQLIEQRQVSSVLGELRGLITGLGEQLRGTATSARLEGLGGDVSSLSAELRGSTTALGERVDALARTVDEQGASTSSSLATQGSGLQSLAVRTSGLADDLSTHSAALERLTAAVDALQHFPDALGGLQSEIAGLHDQLDPLAEVRTTLVELNARTGELEAVRPELAALGHRLQGLATLTANDLVRARDGLQSLMTERLDRLEARPVLTQEGLDSALAPLLAHVATGPQVVDRLGGLDDRLTALEERLGALGQQLATVGELAGGVPAVAGDLSRVAARVEELTELRAEVQAVGAGVVSLQEDTPLPSLVLGVAGLREDVEDVAVRLTELHVPTAEAVAVAVEQQVVEPLVDVLAPRVAELVLSRVAATLVEQVAASVTTSVQSGLTERVRVATADSERRISAHVDEAVLVLAEALLRRRRVIRSGGALGSGVEDGGQGAGPAPVPAASEAPAAQPVVSSPPAAAGSVDGPAQVDQEAALDESGASAGADGGTPQDGDPQGRDRGDSPPRSPQTIRDRIPARGSPGTSARGRPEPVVPCAAAQPPSAPSMPLRALQNLRRVRPRTLPCCTHELLRRAPSTAPGAGLCRTATALLSAREVVATRDVREAVDGGAVQDASARRVDVGRLRRAGGAQQRDLRRLLVHRPPS